jgi:hypothetical protein
MAPCQQLVTRHFNGIIAALEARRPDIDPHWSVWSSKTECSMTPRAGPGASYRAWTSAAPIGNRCWRRIRAAPGTGRSDCWERTTSDPNRTRSRARPHSGPSWRCRAPRPSWPCTPTGVPPRLAIHEQAAARTLQAKVGRNEPCPCCSSKKFKVVLRSACRLASRLSQHPASCAPPHPRYPTRRGSTGHRPRPARPDQGVLRGHSNFSWPNAGPMMLLAMGATSAPTARPSTASMAARTTQATRPGASGVAVRAASVRP